MGSAGIEGLGQLLGDGGAAALGGIPRKEGAEKHAAQGLEIHTGMLVEAFVLRSHGGLDQRGCQFLIGDESPVFYMISSKDFPFFRDDLGGQLGVRIFQFFDGGDICESPYEAKQQHHKEHRGDEQNPEPPGYFFLCTVRHDFKFFTSAQDLRSWAKFSLQK